MLKSIILSWKFSCINSNKLRTRFLWYQIFFWFFLYVTFKCFPAKVSWNLFFLVFVKLVYFGDGWFHFAFHPKVMIYFIVNFYSLTGFLVMCIQGLLNLYFILNFLNNLSLGYLFSFWFLYFSLHFSGFFSHWNFKPFSSHHEHPGIRSAPTCDSTVLCKSIPGSKLLPLSVFLALDCIFFALVANMRGWGLCYKTRFGLL